MSAISIIISEDEMRFGVYPGLQPADWPLLLEHWRVADGVPLFEYGATSDHFYGVRPDENGDWFANDDVPYLEAWTTLTALAQATTRLRLCVLVSAMPYRHPGMLANMVATIDHISNGRLEVGLGTGWCEPEADAYGLPIGTISERFDRLEEGVAVIQGLLSQDRFSFAGKHYTVTDAVCEPKGLQRPHPPILIGGGGVKRTIPLAARWAQHWNFGTPDVELWSQRQDRLDEVCADIGRNPLEIMRSTCCFWDPDVTPDLARSFRDAGADLFFVIFNPLGDPADIERAAEALEDLG